MIQSGMFDGAKRSLDEAIEETADSLRAHGAGYSRWCVCYSGGKDSTALLAVVAHLVASGRVPRPASLCVLYADTRMELPPLKISAEAMMHCARRQGWTCETVLPPLDERFMVYMLGKGVPPPSNTFRWCTSQIKVEPMLAAVQALAARQESEGRTLMLTGVRLGESAARDRRISLSCSKDGGECGQGWFQEATPESIADTLAPILSWRICHVWECLMHRAAGWGFPTARVIADVYGGTNDMQRLADIAARTGCVGCNLASRDDALGRTLSLPQWAYLAPLKRLRPLYAELKLPANRLRKAPAIDGSGLERRLDGAPVANQGRMGPLTPSARLKGLDAVLAIQGEINEAARRQDRPEYSLIDQAEEARIRELIALPAWPRGWTGSEPVADSLPYDVLRDGGIQPHIDFDCTEDME